MFLVSSNMTATCFVVERDRGDCSLQLSSLLRQGTNEYQ
jgi:hypothetical protein